VIQPVFQNFLIENNPHKTTVFRDFAAASVASSIINEAIIRTSVLDKYNYKCSKLGTQPTTRFSIHNMA
jgi:hypothetical protein